MNKRHGARDPCVSAPRGCGEALLCSTGAEAKYKNLNLEFVRKSWSGLGHCSGSSPCMLLITKKKRNLSGICKIIRYMSYNTQQYQYN